MLTVMLALVGCKKDDEGSKETAKSTPVSHGEITAPPGFNEAIGSGKPVLVDFYADW